MAGSTVVSPELQALGDGAALDHDRDDSRLEGVELDGHHVGLAAEHGDPVVEGGDDDRDASAVRRRFHVGQVDRRRERAGDGPDAGRREVADHRDRLDGGQQEGVVRLALRPRPGPRP